MDEGHVRFFLLLPCFLFLVSRFCLINVPQCCLDVLTRCPPCATALALGITFCSRTLLLARFPVRAPNATNAGSGGGGLVYARVKPRFLDRFERQHGIVAHANWHQLPGSQRALVPLQAWPSSHLVSTQTQTHTARSAQRRGLEHNMRA